MWFLTELLGTKAALAFPTSARDTLAIGPGSCRRNKAAKQQALQSIDTRGKPGKENAMLNLIKKLAKDESGQDLAEYGIALAVVAVAAATAAVAISGNVSTLWSR